MPTLRSPAPDFKATAYLRSEDRFLERSLSDYKGKWLCLYFYPADFSPVCPTDLQGFDRVLDQFEDRGCDVLACSTDSQLAHRAWCQQCEALVRLRHPILSDASRRISMDYGVLLPELGIALRGTFLIDPQGLLRWMAVYDLPTGRSTDEVLRVLDALQTDEGCPCNWRKGQATVQ